MNVNTFPNLQTELYSTLSQSFTHNLSLKRCQIFIGCFLIFHSKRSRTFLSRSTSKDFFVIWYVFLRHAFNELKTICGTPRNLSRSCRYALGVRTPQVGYPWSDQLKSVKKKIGKHLNWTWSTQNAAQLAFKVNVSKCVIYVFYIYNNRASHRKLFFSIYMIDTWTWNKFKCFDCLQSSVKHMWSNWRHFHCQVDMLSHVETDLLFWWHGLLQGFSNFISWRPAKLFIIVWSSQCQSNV